MQFLCRLVISILPFPLVGLVCLKTPSGPVWSLVFSCLAVLAWCLLSKWQGTAGPRLGSPFGLLLGVGIGAALTIASVIALGVVQAYPVGFDLPSADMLLYRMVGSIRPACVEETFMRGGTVHFLASFFGPGWAYLGGSVPFALIHFWNGRFSWEHLVCISSAGLMLSVVYLECGLLAAIGVHFTWNVLSWYLIVTLHWHTFGGARELEGAWTTTFIMLIATVAIVMVSRRRQLAQRQGRLGDHEDSRAQKT